MIAKITRGDQMGGLVRYLAGPGRHNEHDRPHVVGASAGIDTPIGRELSDAELDELVIQMGTTRALYDDVEVAGGHVWHLSLTNRADDRPLDDEQWAEVVSDAMTRLGFDDDGKAPAPWVAIHHGASSGENDHVHVAVSLVREDGTRASIWRDRVKISAVCRDAEQRHELVQVDGRHGGGTLPDHSRAELEITERNGRPEPVRQTIARDVRAAADASRDEAEFVRRLHAAGYRSRPRYASEDRSQVIGYSVRLDEDNSRWWAGGKLAADLSLPALRTRWDHVEDEQQAWEPANTTAGREGVELGSQSWKEALDRTQRVVRDVGERVESGEMSWGDVARDGAGVAAALAHRLEGVQPAAMARSADALARSAQRDLLRATRPRPLSGVATVVLQGTKSDSSRALLLLAMEIVRLMDTMRQVHAAQAQLERAREMQRHAGALSSAIEQARSGARQWQQPRNLAAEQDWRRRQDRDVER